MPVSPFAAPNKKNEFKSIRSRQYCHIEDGSWLINFDTKNTEPWNGRDCLQTRRRIYRNRKSRFCSSHNFLAREWEKKDEKRKHILQRYEWCVENQIISHWLLTLQQSEKDLFSEIFDEPVFCIRCVNNLCQAFLLFINETRFGSHIFNRLMNETHVSDESVTDCRVSLFCHTKNRRRFRFFPNNNFIEYTF